MGEKTENIWYIVKIIATIVFVFIMLLLPYAVIRYYGKKRGIIR